MIRGMDNFGDVGDDGESDASNAHNVSVNFAADVGEVSARRVSRDTDTESFTYEHFPVVCPTCRGVGQVHEGDLVLHIMQCSALLVVLVELKLNVICSLRFHLVVFLYN